MPFELKLFLTFLFLAYFFYFIFSKKSIKTFIPLMGLGYISGPFGWNLLGRSMENFAMIFLLPSVFILGMQMGRGFDLNFWRFFPIESFFSNLTEKVILIIVFLAIFFLVIPSMLFLPVSFPFYFAIVAFSSSFFFVFVKFIPADLKIKVLDYYQINHFILILLLVVFHFIFPSSYEQFIKVDWIDQIIFLFLFAGLTLVLFKGKIEDSKTILILVLTLIFLASVFSQTMGFFPLILGFLMGIFSNFMPIKVQLSIKRIFFFFNEYMIYVFIFLAGFLMDISINMILLGILYLFLRFFARLVIYTFTFKKMEIRNFFRNDSFFLLQGEYLLAFLIIYAVEYQFYTILSVGIISLAFSDFLLHYYYHKFQKK